MDVTMTISDRQFNGIVCIIFGLIAFFDSSISFYFGFNINLGEYKNFVAFLLIVIGILLIFYPNKKT